jgi:exopolysaccharide biosynthesis polyprenyl glycosylphosphotransferase
LVRLFNVYYPTRILFLLIAEVLAIFVSFVAAGFTLNGQDFLIVLNYQSGFEKIALVSGLCFLCIYYFDLYETGIVMNEFEILTRLIQVLGTTCLILAALYFVFPQIRLESRVLGLGLLIVGIWLVGLRQLFLVLNRSTSLAIRTIIIGGGPLAESLASEIQKRPELGIRLLGCVGQTANVGSEASGLHRLGGLDDLPTIVERTRASQVIVAMTERRGRLPLDSLMQIKARGIRIQNGEDVYENLAGKVPLESFRLSWLLFSPASSVSRPMLFYKRAASVLFSTLGLILTFPIMILIALAIRLDSKGPILFPHDRVGKDGKTFRLYKFRSMHEAVDSDGKHTPALVNDDRITRVGRWLRRTRLDELPQLYNILRGDMYVIGPRPFVPNQEQELVEKIPYYRQRWLVKPGATGWAQINQGYCASVEDNTEKLAYDLFYIKNMSHGLDFWIILGTIKVLLLGRGSR